MKEKYIEKIIKLSEKAYKRKEIPVGAIIVYKNKIIGRGYNNRQKNHDVLGHAEINAIKNASKKMRDWRLDDCEMYVTLSPCKMCEEIIKQSRIKNIYYIKLNKENNALNNKYIQLENNEKYEKIFESFFEMLRKK